MRVEEMLAQLREELVLIEKAIADIENMRRGVNRRRCRPPGLAGKSNRNEVMRSSSRQLRRLDH
jgi:hypothetical protein